MIYNIIVAILFTYYTIYCTRLFREDTREHIKEVNNKLNTYRRMPIKTLEQQKKFLDIKRPHTVWKFDKEFWKTLSYQLLIYVIIINVWLYIFNWQKIQWQLWHTILLLILFPLFVNVFLDKFNLEQSDFLAIFRGSKKDGNNRPKSKRPKISK